MLHHYRYEIYDGNNNEIETIDCVLVHCVELETRFRDNNDGEKGLEYQGQQRVDTEYKSEALFLQIACNLGTESRNKLNECYIYIQYINIYKTSYLATVIVKP